MSVFDALIERDYEEGLARGLRLSGESADFFARRRVEATRSQCQSADVDLVMDFGCGPGYATPHLLAAFPAASIVGVDSSAAMIDAARQRHSGSRVEFWHGRPQLRRPADLVYCNGVFHHIPKDDRLTVLKQLIGWTRSGGFLAFWENNPWNPGTHLVMRRIPFDRDASMLTSREAGQVIAAAGFTVVRTTFWFFFPRALRAFRSLEPRLRRVPFGGQYCVLARKTP